MQMVGDGSVLLKTAGVSEHAAVRGRRCRAPRSLLEVCKVTAVHNPGGAGLRWVGGEDDIGRGAAPLASSS